MQSFYIEEADYICGTQTNSTFEKITKRSNPDSLQRKEREKNKSKRKSDYDKRNWN